MTSFYSIEAEHPGEWGGETRFVNYDEIRAGLTYRRKLKILKSNLILCPKMILSNVRDVISLQIDLRKR